jgi:hypothetical protein
MTSVSESKRLVEGIVRLRRAERIPEAAAEVSPVRRELEAALGPTLSRSRTAQILGVSQTALDRWVRAGQVPIVLTPAGRREVPRQFVVELREAIGELGGKDSRHPLAAALATRREAAAALVGGSPSPDLHGAVAKGMRRSELEHVIRAAAAVTGDEELLVVGSQAILGQFPDAPEELLASREADLYPRNHPERGIEIDGSLGDGSYFDAAYGYFANAVGPETATLPRDWERRLIAVRNENTGGATGWCLEIHDLLLSKCVAGRERDWEFAEVALRHGLADAVELRGRLGDLPISGSRLEAVRKGVDGVVSRGPSKGSG